VIDSLELIFDSLPALLRGALLTVQLVALSLACGFVLAVPLALLRARGGPLLRWPVELYLLFFRGTPLLVQMFLIYYGFGQFPAFRESVLWPLLREAYWCAIIAFTLNTAAYTAEIFRGAIEGVPKGEVEAARSLGLSGWLLFRLIVLPRAFRVALPAYGNEMVLMLKGSALASTITLVELTGAARIIVSQTAAPYEPFVTAGLIYLALALLIDRGVRGLERRLDHTA